WPSVFRFPCIPPVRTWGFDFHAVTVELLISKKFRRQHRRLASTGIIDLPQTHDRRLCFCRWRKCKAAKHQKNCSECNADFFILILLLLFWPFCTSHFELY